MPAGAGRSGSRRQCGISERTQRAPPRNSAARCHRLPGCLDLARSVASVAMNQSAAVRRGPAVTMRNILVRTVLTAGLLAGANAAQSATMTLSNWKFGAGNAVPTSTPAYRGAACVRPDIGHRPRPAAVARRAAGAIQQRVQRPRARADEPGAGRRGPGRFGTDAWAAHALSVSGTCACGSRHRPRRTDRINSSPDPAWPPRPGPPHLASAAHASMCWLRA